MRLNSLLLPRLAVKERAFQGSAALMRSHERFWARRMKAVLDTKEASEYDDDTSRHYHFPQRYLQTVEQARGDWVVLRRPTA